LDSAAPTIRLWRSRTTEDEIVETLLERAFAEASKLPKDEQDVLAARLLAELAVEDDFDRAMAGSAHELGRLAEQAIAEFRGGKTEELDPDRP
jgi:hypothetical protein